MDPAITDPQPKEARMLAAIVFTDVVGFSKLASQNEARVYVALQRDMGVMTNLCRAHGGQVLNTMGDGMLLCFTSAVDAMSCAIEIQRTLHNQSLSLPPVEVLHHRIGVHLGDVIMNGDNVFGDGVNIAARLQALAKPDAVCFSGTVSEIIKNKLKVDAIYLGPRQLKNIGEPVKVWQVAPISEGRPSALAGQAMAEAATGEPVTGASGAKAALLVLASLVLVGGLGFGIVKMRKPIPAWTPKVQQPKQAKSPSGSENPATPSTSATTGGTISPPPPNAQELRNKFSDLKNHFEFSAIVSLLQSNGPQLPDENEKLPQWQKLAEMETEVAGAIQQANGLPGAIRVASFTMAPGRALPANVYLQDRVLTVQTDEDGTKSLPNPISPQNYSEIARAVMEKNGKDPAQEAELLDLFSKEYGLSGQ